MLEDFSQLEREQQADDEDILQISRRLMDQNRQAYETLAQ